MLGSQPDRRRATTMLAAIVSVRRGVTPPGGTLHRRRADVLASIDHHASTGRQEHQRPSGSLAPNARGFRYPHPLPTALTAALRRPDPTDRSTPKSGRPDKA